MLASVLPSLLNGEPIDLAQVPHFGMAEFRAAVTDNTNAVTRRSGRSKLDRRS